jgi:hypothetical protein
MGRARDLTGSYALGLRGLVVPSLGAAFLMFVLTRDLERSKRNARSATLANELA